MVPLVEVQIFQLVSSHPFLGGVQKSPAIVFAWGIFPCSLKPIGRPSFTHQMLISTFHRRVGPFWRPGGGCCSDFNAIGLHSTGRFRIEVRIGPSQKFVLEAWDEFVEFFGVNRSQESKRSSPIILNNRSNVCR